VFDQDHTQDGGYDSAIDEDSEPYFIKLLNKDKHEVAQLKCHQLQPLKNLSDSIKDARQQLENLGLPLTIEPHDCHKESFLNTDDIELRGMVNLLVLLLMSYHLRAIVDRFAEEQSLPLDLFSSVYKSGYLSDPWNYMTLLAGINLAWFPTFGFVLEKAAGNGYLGDRLVIFVEILYLSAMLVYPIVLIQWVGSTALPATYLMLCAVCQFLKLTSFHHVCYDNRRLLTRINDHGKKPDEAVEDLATLFNINERTMSTALQYPKNLSIRHFLRFLLAPTCCYQFVYPTSPSVRVSYVFKRVVEFLFCYYFMWYLIAQHMVPIAEGAILSFRARNYLGILMSTLHMAVPASYMWLTVFYSTFHSWLNFLAELT